MDNKDIVNEYGKIIFIIRNLEASWRLYNNIDCLIKKSNWII